MGSAPSPPPPPDSNIVSAAQGAANVNTAKAESFLKNANVIRPEGNLEWEWLKDANGDYVTETIIYTNKDTGAEISREEVRKPVKKVTLAPKLQSIFERENDVKLAINQWALQQVGLITTQQQAPLTTDGLAPWSAMPTAPVFDQTPLIDRPLVQQIGGGDATAYLDQIKSEIKLRLQPDIDRARAREIARLDRMGLAAGMEAYDRAIENLTRQENDLNIEAELKARQDLTRQVQTEAMIGDFANKAKDLALRHQKLRIDHGNSVNLQIYQAAVDLANFVFSQRNRELQERISVRGHNVNEIVALIHGGHVQVPQFANWKGSNIAPPPVAESAYRSYAAELDIWKSEVAQSNQTLGAALSFGGNLLGGLTAIGPAAVVSDQRVKRDIVRIDNDPRGFGWYSYRYQWEPVGVRHIGVMAQELLEHMPDAVVFLPSGLLAVDYGRVLH
jgi:hypothetical protein